MPRRYLYGLGNHRLGLNVPNSVFSELPGVCRLMAKGAERFNELEMLGNLEGGLWSESACCEDEGQQKARATFVAFFKQPADLLQRGNFLPCSSVD